MNFMIDEVGTNNALRERKSWMAWLPGLANLYRTFRVWRASTKAQPVELRSRAY